MTTVLRREQGDVEITAQTEDIEVANALAEARAAIKAWEERADYLKGVLLERLEDADVLVKGGRVLVRRTLVQPKARFSASEFASDYPDLHDAYRREVPPYWKITV